MHVLEQVLRRAVSEEKAREILYYPGEADACLYPLLLANAPAKSPEDHPQTKAQIIALGPMYVVCPFYSLCPTPLSLPIRSKK